VRGMSVSSLNLCTKDGRLFATLTEPVIEYLLEQRQSSWCKPERGGQIFAKLEISTRLVEVTGPSLCDRSGSTWFEIERESAQRQILARFAYGVHFIGDWHTHAQQYPSPSARDIESMRSLFVTSTHELSFMLMIIVGSEPRPEQWWYSIHTAECFEQLNIRR
jgi:integrative and conjugative element protein (TIGR02256 family)